MKKAKIISGILLIVVGILIIVYQFTSEKYLVFWAGSLAVLFGALKIWFEISKKNNG